MFTLKVIRCSNLRNVARVIRQDPFVQIYLEGSTESAKTGVCIAGGTRPEWSSKNLLRLNLPKTNGELPLVIEVWDKEFTQGNRLIASTIFRLQDEILEEVPSELELYFEGVPAGVLECIINYDPSTKEELPQTIKSEADGLSSKMNPTYLKKSAEIWFSNPYNIGKLFFISSLFLNSWSKPFILGIFYVSLHIIWYVIFYLGLPIGILVCLPRFLGWTLTKIVEILAYGYPITFGTISIILYITDLKDLKFRITVTDFFMGNPSGAGFTSKFLSLDRLNCEGSVPFEHLYNLATLNYIPVKLKKVPDFKRLATFTIDRLEFDGFTMDFQVSKNKKLNINEMTKEFALGEVRTSLKAKGVDLDQIKFPNTLEVQVIRARNLIAMDSKGTSCG